MPEYRFRLEDNAPNKRDCVMDCPDLNSAHLTAKYVARQLAAKDILKGRLRLSQMLLIEDELGLLVDSVPLDEAICIS